MKKQNKEKIKTGLSTKLEIAFLVLLCFACIFVLVFMFAGCNVHNNASAETASFNGAYYEISFKTTPSITAVSYVSGLTYANGVVYKYESAVASDVTHMGSPVGWYSYNTVSNSTASATQVSNSMYYYYAVQNVLSLGGYTDTFGGDSIVVCAALSNLYYIYIPYSLLGDGYLSTEVPYILAEYNLLIGLDTVDTYNILSSMANDEVYEDGYIAAMQDYGHTDAEINEAYELGYERGAADNSSAGYDDGYIAGYNAANANEQASYDSGYSDGLLVGENTANEELYTEGYNAGFSKGYSDGSADGHNTGYDLGYDAGYIKGNEDGRFTSLVTSDEDVAYAYNQGQLLGYENGFADGETSGYDKGYHDGELQGFIDGRINGYLNAVIESNEEVYNEGYNNGKNDGNTLGYDTGYEEGYEDGLNEVEDTIYTSGYEVGYTEGYAEGFVIRSEEVESVQGLVDFGLAFVNFGKWITLYWYFIVGGACVLVAGTVFVIIGVKRR